MNIENIKKAIAIMERAKNHDSVYMCDWQSKGINNTLACDVYNERDLHRCGNKACFAGHIAISQEFIDDGGRVHQGVPYIRGYGAHIAISLWLGITAELADFFVYGDTTTTTGLIYSKFYGKDWRDVKAQDVIDKLNLLLAGEL